MSSFLQTAWRSVLGKASILDQNPLRSATTIPEANWNRRWIKRSGDANSDPSPLVRETIEFIHTFAQNLENLEFNYRPALITALRMIRRIETDTSHKQMAMELTNYVKKLVRRYRAMTDRVAIELNDSISAGIEEANVMAHVEEASRRANASSSAVARMHGALGIPEVSNANLEEFMRVHGTASAESATGATANAEAEAEAEAGAGPGANNENLAEFMRVHGYAATEEPAHASGVSNANLAAVGISRANFEAVNESGISNANLVAAGMPLANIVTSRSQKTTRRKRTLRGRKNRRTTRRR